MPTTVPLWIWASFVAFVLAMLALDLGVFNRKAHVVSVKQALAWTGVWISLSLIFCLGIPLFYHSHRAMEFLTGYLIEYSLSIDNIFVFLLIFGYFKVVPQHQHTVLFWGILGALVMRGAMIAGGAALLHRFEWILYIFGAFLIYTGVRLALGKNNDIDPAKNPFVNGLKRLVPVSENFHGNKFFIHKNGRRTATPLLVVLLVVETTDLVFAVDSIPAIFGVTTDPFIVFTSNIFAILGLRSLYFALAGVMNKFHFLQYALAFILAFIGLKMLLAETLLAIPTMAALGVVISALVLAVVMSLRKPPKNAN